MGFFDKPEVITSGWGGSEAFLPPLSKERISQVLTALEINHATDDDGDLVASFGEDGYFYFLQHGSKGEMFTVRGTWFGILPPDRFEDLGKHCQEWNTTRFFPKTYPIELRGEGEEGTASRGCRVAAEMTIDYEHGLTDAQLRQHLTAALYASLQLFEELHKSFPERTMD